MDEVRRFYDELAADYHLIYADWSGSVRRQARALDALIVEHLGPGPHRILDCTCGIGTQALGLAALGHEVVGTDLSEAALERASAEARVRGLELDLHRRDVREIEDLPGGPFDVVLSADNSLPHLTDPDDLHRAVRGMCRQTVPGGLVLVSTRDYDALLDERPRIRGPWIMGESGDRRIVLQLWDWQETEPIYRLHHLILHESGGDWRLSRRSCDYRAVRRAELEAAFREAGSPETAWLEPDATGFFQPILLALWPDSSGRG